MEYLPQEIISYILQYLSVSDRKEASLVCRAWYEASLDPILLRDTVVTFHAPSTTPNNFDKLGYRKTPHLILDQIDGSFSSKQFLIEECSHLTGGLQSLSLKGSNITENLFAELLAQCTKLETLDLSCCNSLFMSGLILSKPNDVAKLSKSLVHLKSLNLSNIRYLSDTTLNRITSACQNLQKLHLAGAQIIFHSDKYFTKSSDAIMTFNNILNVISQKAKQFKSLDFSRTSINDEALASLAAVKDLRLEQLILVGCREMYSTGIGNVARKQTQLKDLDLSQCVDICDGSLYSICEHLHDLRNLNLNKCRQITDASIKNLHMLDRIEKLELASNYTMTSKVLSTGLCKGKLLKLTHLNLNCCSLINDSFIIQMCKVLNQLTFLDLGSTGLTDIGLQFICTYLFKLKSLTLSWCREISDKGLTGEVLELESDFCVEHIDSGVCRCTKKKMGENILNLPKTEDKQKKSTANALLGEPKSVNSLKSLQTLKLSSCPKITDESVSQFQLPELRCLEIEVNNGITDVSLLAISKNMKCLEILNINQCSEVSDAGVIPIVRSLRRLSGLHFSNCDQITNKTVHAIHSYAHRLQDLDVSMCGQVSNKELDNMQHGMRQLHTVQRRLVGGRLSAGE